MPLPYPQTFTPAAPCRRLILMLILAAVCVAVVDVLSAFMQFRIGRHSQIPPLAIVSLIGAPALVALVWLCSRIRGYQIADGVLQVRRLLYSPKFPLAGLKSVDLCRNAFDGARKKHGNDGLGAISGLYSSQKLGEFRAYLSDPDKGVMLVLGDGRSVLVSPEQTRPFIDAVKRSAG
jgi:hypothetical protein